MTGTPPALSSLPPPDVVEALDFEAINAAHQAELIARHPAAAGVLALESEPLTKLIESHAYRELLFRARVNEAARAYLLAYASGADLDHKGAFYGLARLPGESDERYRLRIQLRIRALAGNGTREAYELAALTAAPLLRAARATQPAPGSVLVLLWVPDGVDGSATLASVTAALNADDARILGVNLLVALARPRPIHISARLYRDATAPADLVAQLAAALPALIEAHSALGRELSRAWITARLMAPGIAHVDYPGASTPPELTVLAADEYAVASTIDLTDAGVIA